MTPELFSKEYKQYWDQLKSGDKVLVKSNRFFDNCSEATLRAGPSFISDMRKQCSELRTVKDPRKHEEDSCYIRFNFLEEGWTWCDVFCHRLIIRKHRLLL